MEAISMNSIKFLNSLKSIAENYSENDAFYINRNTYNYFTFYQKVNDISNELLSTKQEQLRVIVATNNDIETYASIIAIWLTGNIYIPLNFGEESNQLKSKIKTIKPDILLSSTPIKQKILTKHNNIITSEINKNTEIKTLNTIKLNNVAYILFTSGTTGTPKGVPISYKNLNTFVESFLSSNFSISEKDVFLQMADLTFDMSIISFLIPLCIGAKIVTTNNSNVKYLATYKALEENKISVLVTAPSTLQLLEPYYPEINLEDLRHTFVGAEAFYESTAKEWLKCAPNSQITNLYGPSEGGILSSYHNWNENNISHNKIVSIGKPVKHIKLQIVDKNGEITQSNKKGEIWISGEQVFSSYLNPTENKNKFGFLTVNGTKDKYFKTGDIAFRNNSGHLFYCGRLDKQVKIQGQRVELTKIEHYANQQATNFNSIALCYKDQFNSNKIALFIDNETNKENLIKLLKKNLPTYMIPSKIIKIDALPLNKNLKTDTSKLMSYLEK